MNDIMKIVKSLEESGLLTKRVSEIIRNKAKEQKRGFPGMILGTLEASFLGKFYQVQLEQEKAQLELVKAQLK